MQGAVLYVGSQNCHLHVDGQTIAIPSILYIKQGANLAALWYDCRRIARQTDCQKADESAQQAELLASSSLFRSNFTASACFKGFVALFLRSKPIQFCAASLLSGMIDVASGNICDISALLAVFFMQIKFAFDVRDLRVVLPDIPLQNIGLLYQLTGCHAAEYYTQRKYVDFDVEIERYTSKPSQFAYLRQQVFKIKKLAVLAECGGRPLECYFNSYFGEILANSLGRKSLAAALGCSLDFVGTVMGTGDVYSLDELVGVQKKYASIAQKHAAADTCGEALKYDAYFADSLIPQFRLLELPELKYVIWVQGKTLRVGETVLEVKQQESSAVIGRFGVYFTGFVAVCNGQTVLVGGDKSTIVWCY